VECSAEADYENNGRRITEDYVESIHEEPPLLRRWGRKLDEPLLGATLAVMRQDYTGNVATRPVVLVPALMLPVQLVVFWRR
jgi:hypothetical protein